MAEKTTKKKTSKPSVKTANTSAKTPVKAKGAVKPARSTVSKTAPSVETSSPAVDEKTNPAKAFRVKRSYFFTVLGILLLVALAVLLRNYVIAASVNGRPISRLAVVRELEKQGGKQALDGLVMRELIRQKAEEKNIQISDKEVSDEIKKLDDQYSKQGQKLDQVLQLSGMTREQLQDNVRIQKTIEKLIGPIAVTDQEVEQFITNNQESLPQDQNPDEQRKEVKERLANDKLSEQAQKYLDDLRKNAKVDYYVNY